jgi:hypothetical protein
MPIKIAHEAPLNIFTDIQKLTDYDYCLVHLLEESKEYLTYFKKAIADGREVVLDNSIFELGTAFDPNKFASWVREIKPTYYIVPDALEDKELTIQQYDSFVEKYPDLPGKRIAVVQGKSYLEVVECYKHLVNKCDKIAISFDYSFFENWFPNEKNKYWKWTKGRQKLLLLMLQGGIIDQSKPHHLLGCGIACEFSLYKDFNWIDSLDTSNPVVAGLKHLRYDSLKEGWGLEDKPSEKLFTLINTEVSEEQKELIFFNVQRFRENLTAGLSNFQT